MNRILDGVMCLIDDVLVFGKSQEEHDTQLLAVFKSDSKKLMLR